MVAASGLVGFGFAAARFEDPLTALSQQASLLAGILYAALAVAAVVAPRASLPWARGASAVLLGLVAIGYGVLLSPDYAPVHSLLEHVVTPALVLLDFTIVDRRAVPLWCAATWLVAPLAYLVYYRASDLTFYGFLNGTFQDVAPAILALLVGVSILAVILAAQSLRGAAGRRLDCS